MQKDYLAFEDGWSVANRRVNETFHHTVEEGETFRSIARYYYGDSKLWRVIMNYNNMHSPEELKEGMEIDIPPL